MTDLGARRSAWAGLAEDLRGSGVAGAALLERAEEALAAVRHGDLPDWLAALDALPDVATGWKGAQAAPRLGAEAGDPGALREGLMAFHPWRKGPLRLGGVTIDTEWRSDWKWDRIAEHLDLAGATVLDVGCGNGYFGWRMLGAGARCVVGIDPTVLFVVQWLVQRHFSGPAPNYVLPLRDTDLETGWGEFDAVFSMGVLYHRREPDDHLRRLRGVLRPGGQLVLETLVVNGDRPLHPPGRYARMRNVHEVPTVDGLRQRLTRLGFDDPELVDLNRTTTREQRSTAWMRFESLDRCLDPGDPTRTVEGHPAPLRATILARR